jgi:hypothetical protein
MFLWNVGSHEDYKALYSKKMVSFITIALRTTNPPWLYLIFSKTVTAKSDLFDWIYLSHYSSLYLHFISLRMKCNVAYITKSLLTSGWGGHVQNTLLFASSARILASFRSVLCYVLYALIPTFLVCQYYALMPLPHTLSHDTFNLIYKIIVLVFPLILHLPVPFYSINCSLLVYWL